MAVNEKPLCDASSTPLDVNKTLLSEHFHHVWAVHLLRTRNLSVQALEDEFARKLQEQEVFFKMTGESACLNPSSQSRISKFYPVPSVHSTGF